MVEKNQFWFQQQVPTFEGIQQCFAEKPNPTHISKTYCHTKWINPTFPIEVTFESGVIFFTPPEKTTGVPPKWRQIQWKIVTSKYLMINVTWRTGCNNRTSRSKRNSCNLWDRSCSNLHRTSCTGNRASLRIAWVNNARTNWRPWSRDCLNKVFLATLQSK